MSLNPKSLQINKIVYNSIENKPILIFLKDVRCEAQTPVDLKERVRESLGTYSPRPGTGASQNASPRATARISRNVCAQSKRGSTGVCIGYLKYNIMTKSKYQICINLEFIVGIKRDLYMKDVT